MTLKEWLKYQQEFLEELQFLANLKNEILILPEEQNLCNLIMTKAKDFLERKKLPLKPSPANTAPKPSPG